MSSAFFSGPVEADESFFGGKEGNKHASKKCDIRGGQTEKTGVSGIKDRETNQVRAKVFERINKKNLHGTPPDENILLAAGKYRCMSHRALARFFTNASCVVFLSKFAGKCFDWAFYGGGPLRVRWALRQVEHPGVCCFLVPLWRARSEHVLPFESWQPEDSFPDYIGEV